MVQIGLAIEISIIASSQPWKDSNHFYHLARINKIFNQKNNFSLGLKNKSKHHKKMPPGLKSFIFKQPGTSGME